MNAEINGSIFKEMCNVNKVIYLEEINDNNYAIEKKYLSTLFESVNLHIT